MVTVAEGSHTKFDLTLIVVKEDLPNIVGRDWLQSLGMLTDSTIRFKGVSAVNRVTTTEPHPQLTCLLQKFASVFELTIGKALKYTCEIELRQVVAPVFQKA